MTPAKRGVDAPPARDRGELTARALAGSWRPDARSALTAEELAAVAPHLLATGAGGLGWWSVRDRPALAESPAGAGLRDAHRLHTLHAGLHDRNLAAVLDVVAGLGIEPFLVKGWTLARRYPARGLRPYGDVDLLVAPGRRPALLRALLEAGVRVDVDLEHAFVAVDGTPVDLLRARSVPVEVAGRDVRVLGAEDELRLTALHYLRAGGWRALSLCDVALLLETRPRELDWRLVLPEGRRGSWVALAAGLAEGLLGADLRGTPLRGAVGRVPPWLRAHVLRGFADTPIDRLPAGAFTRPRSPRDALEQVAARWPPDGLELTLHHGRAVRRRRPRHLELFDVGSRAAALALPVVRASRAPRQPRDPARWG